MQQMMESNPEIARLLEDPETLQQSMRAMRNPQLMREMMRSADRGMANLNTMPGGEAALRRVYNEVQDPLYNAMDGAVDGVTGGAGGNRSGSGNDRYTQSEIPTGAIANPWASNPTPSNPSGGAGLGGSPGLGASPFPGLGGAGGANPFAGLGAGAGGANPFAGLGAGAGAGANPFAGLGGAGAGAGGMPDMSALLGALGQPPAAGATPGSPGTPGQDPFLAMLQGLGAPPAGGAGAPGAATTPGAPPPNPFGANNPFLRLLGPMGITPPPAVIPIGGENPTPETVTASSDEFKFECKYQTHTIYHVIKRDATVKKLKDELEAKVRFRAPYIRVVYSGAVWENDKKLTDYVNEEKGNMPTDGATGIKLFLLKNVPSGQTEIPLLATDSSGIYFWQLFLQFFSPCHMRI